jgi:hypothetical protein
MDRDLTQLSYDKFILESKIAVNKAQYNYYKEKVDYYQSQLEKTEIKLIKNMGELQSISEEMDKIQLNITGE